MNRSAISTEEKHAHQHPRRVRCGAPRTPTTARPSRPRDPAAWPPSTPSAFWKPTGKIGRRIVGAAPHQPRRRRSGPFRQPDRDSHAPSSSSSTRPIGTAAAPSWDRHPDPRQAGSRGARPPRENARRDCPPGGTPWSDPDRQRRSRPVSMAPSVRLSSPTHTPAVMPGVKPTNQASANQLVVPRFAGDLEPGTGLDACAVGDDLAHVAGQRPGHRFRQHLADNGRVHFQHPALEILNAADEVRFGAHAAGGKCGVGGHHLGQRNLGGAQGGGGVRRDGRGDAQRAGGPDHVGQATC